MLETILDTKRFVSVVCVAVFWRMVLMGAGSLVWYRFSLVELSKRKTIYLAEANYALPQRTTGFFVL